MRVEQTGLKSTAFTLPFGSPIAEGGWSDACYQALSPDAIRMARLSRSDPLSHAPRTAGYGAFRPLPGLPAKVLRLNRQRTFSFGRGSSCPRPWKKRICEYGGNADMAVRP
jgi:hypothetical protein